ncbi:DUF916 and DUF3324 domain-containing protein [Enterococcus sp. DIV0187]|uniref:DUF916 and DUF3324 domain-containing protein n=1 Tax=Enterococcus sp. DIV0187 TaxID=2774644 RepID=UPI003F266DC0
MKQLTKMGLFIFLFIGIFSYCLEGNAKDNKQITDTEQRAGFTIHAEIPENQVDQAKSYFHLLVGKDHEQKIKVKIYNNSEKEQTYNVKINSAKTNKNGIVVYDDFETSLDSSMKLPITEIVKPDNETVTVPAWGEGEAVLTIKLNNQSFEGLILGGVHISMKDSEEGTKKGMSVTNRYGYVSGIALVQDKNTNIFGNTELKLIKLKPMVDYGSKVIEAHIQNPNPETFDSVRLNGKVTKKGSRKVLAEHAIDSARIAPNSFLPFQIDWGKDTITAGTYVFEGYAKVKEKKWSFKQEFEISAKTAQKMNNQAVFKLILPDWWKQGALICGIFSILLVCFLIFRTVRCTKVAK